MLKAVVILIVNLLLIVVKLEVTGEFGDVPESEFQLKHSIEYFAGMEYLPGELLLDRPDLLLEAAEFSLFLRMMVVLLMIMLVMMIMASFLLVHIDLAAMAVMLVLFLFEIGDDVFEVDGFRVEC